MSGNEIKQKLSILSNDEVCDENIDSSDEFNEKSDTPYDIVEISGNKIKQKLSKLSNSYLCDDNTETSDEFNEKSAAPYDIVEMSGNEIKQKLSNKFCCEICHYSTYRKSNFDNHLLSLRHHKATFGGNPLKQIKQQSTFECEICSKIYYTNSGLWKHKQNCKDDTIIIKPNDNNISTAEILNIIKTLIKDNQDFTKELINSVVSNQSDTIKEITKCGITNTTNNVNNNSNNNSNNKTFNLQVFLNETCKNAMNLTDFIDSIKLQLSDLIKIGEIGYVEGISNIITSNLQSLDVTQRPIHCTDKKRETVYVKDEDKWEKDDDNNNKIRKLIKKVAYKNENLLPQYKQKHPGCNYSESKYADQYSKIVIEAMSGDKEKDDKIIKNISKAITINKENY